MDLAGRGCRSLVVDRVGGPRPAAQALREQCVGPVGEACVEPGPVPRENENVHGSHERTLTRQVVDGSGDLVYAGAVVLVSVFALDEHFDVRVSESSAWLRHLGDHPTAPCSHPADPGYISTLGPQSCRRPKGHPGPHYYSVDQPETCRHGLNDNGQRNITCLVCGMTSYHPEDIRQEYCGGCHQFHFVMQQAMALNPSWRP